MRMSDERRVRHGHRYSIREQYGHLCEFIRWQLAQPERTSGVRSYLAQVTDPTLYPSPITLHTWLNLWGLTTQNARTPAEARHRAFALRRAFLNRNPEEAIADAQADYDAWLASTGRKPLTKAAEPAEKPVRVRDLITAFNRRLDASERAQAETTARLDETTARLADVNRRLDLLMAGELP